MDALFYIDGYSSLIAKLIPREYAVYSSQENLQKKFEKVLKKMIKYKHLSCKNINKIVAVIRKKTDKHYNYYTIMEKAPESLSDFIIKKAKTRISIKDLVKYFE